mmetsp:Transcript_30640/g.89044  ORF Transcript_30640/g.89044 Transcript_30640/m.89044 type:complete len:227 (-) Transcript_30640:492-1172(-)
MLGSQGRSLAPTAWASGRGSRCVLCQCLPAGGSRGRRRRRRTCPRASWMASCCASGETGALCSSALGGARSGAGSPSPPGPWSPAAAAWPAALLLARRGWPGSRQSDSRDLIGWQAIPAALAALAAFAALAAPVAAAALLHSLHRPSRALRAPGAARPDSWPRPRSRLEAGKSRHFLALLAPRRQEMLLLPRPLLAAPAPWPLPQPGALAGPWPAPRPPPPQRSWR